MKETRETILARKIANRDTELHRAYDRAIALRLRLLLDRDRINDLLSKSDADIVRCRHRALEQGYPDLFTL